MQINRTLVLAQCVTCVLAGLASGNSGVQLPLDQYQAGTEVTDNSRITNAGFEQPGVAGPNATGWTPVNNAGQPSAMSVGAPDPANLPSNPSVLGNFVARAAVPNRNFNDHYEQGVTFAPNTDYVLSGYLWNYGLPGPDPATDLFAGDLAVLQLRDVNNFDNTAGVILEPVRLDGGAGSRGVFIYKTFNSAQFPNGATLEVQSDPNENIFGARPAVSVQFDNIAITPVSQFRAQVWTSATSGNWGDDAKWLNRQANAAGAVATFANQAGPVTVTLDAAKQASAVKFDSAGSYTLAGTNNLMLMHDEDRAPVVLMSLQGQHTISAPIVVGEPSAGGLANIGPRLVIADVAAGSRLTLSNTMTPTGTSPFDLRKQGAGTLEMKNVRARIVKIDDGTLRVLPGASPDSTSRMNLLFIENGTLDLSNTAAILDYPEAGPSELANMRLLASVGKIVASSPSDNLVVGVAEASSFGTTNLYGQEVDSSAILLLSTFKGDTNLDRDVDFDDLLVLAQNYGSTTAAYEQGDTNYDNAVDFDDLLALAQNYGGTFALTGLPEGWSPTGSFASDWALAQSIVPEPTMLSAMAGVALVARRRRQVS